MLSNPPEFTPGKTPKNEAAFTLLEVMVSIAILGVSLIILFELFSGSLKLARTSEDYLKATLLAQTKMNELKLKNFDMEEADSGTFEDNPEYHWSVTVKPYKTEFERAKEKEDIQEVELKVTWKFGGKKNEFNLVRLYSPMTWTASLNLDKAGAAGGRKAGGQSSSGESSGSSSSSGSAAGGSGSTSGGGAAHVSGSSGGHISGL